MNRDPLGEKGGLNLYGFVGNDGINWIDPYGLRSSIFDDPRIPPGISDEQKRLYVKAILEEEKRKEVPQLLNIFTPTDFFKITENELYDAFAIVAGIDALVSISVSVRNMECCDKNNKRHYLLVNTFCIGASLAVTAKIGVGIDEDMTLQKCPKLDSNGKTWRTCQNPSVYGAIGVGVQWDYDAPTTRRVILGLGGGVYIFGGCSHNIMIDREIGDCCYNN